MEADDLGDGYSVVSTAAKLHALLTEVLPDVSDHLQRIVAVKVQAAYLRLQDYGSREHILLVWLVEGNIGIRSHNGCVYICHNDGSLSTNMPSLLNRHSAGCRMLSRLQTVSSGYSELAPKGTRPRSSMRSRLRVRHT